METTFDAFFAAVWGHSPFPWQSTLAQRVVEEGWPDVLDLPTGAGKTAALDIALWHLAVDGGTSAPRRIVLVVDRRVIVDQVSARARRIAAALAQPQHAATRAVADALRALVGPDDPLLQTAVLRGAALRDDAWAHRPHVPVLAASTVDQIGSRLFFRGYGVSDSMRPVHAGLIGCDTLMLLDEVHLARPFADVLSQFQGLRGTEGLVPRRFRIVELSATPGVSQGTPFRLTEEDRRVAELDARLRARKPATLEKIAVPVRAEESAKRAAVAKNAAVNAKALVEEGRQAVAVVVNRVDTARRTWRLLESDHFDRVLLTGRMRPLDQQQVLAEVSGRVLADRLADSGASPLVVIATQCIEAGADYDFDGMVTECASLDALRQRFGRVDRRGRRPARVVILGRSDLVEGKEGDPVYGEALYRTWEWLEGLQEGAEFDVGIDGLAPHIGALGDDVDLLKAPSRAAPVLMPTYLDQWAQTNPAPHADPDVGLFLHGIPEDARSALSDVQVVWRADVTSADLQRAADDPAAMSRLQDQMTAVPPGAMEALALPVWTVSRWLAGDGEHGDDDIADVDGQMATAPDGLDGGQRVLAWRGRLSEIVDATSVAPGTLIVIPSELGGLGPHGTFDPDDREDGGSPLPVSDLGDAVQLTQRGIPTLRLDPRVLAPWIRATLPAIDEDADVRQRMRDALSDIVDAIQESDAPDWLRATTALVQRRTRLARLDSTDGEGAQWLAIGRRMTAAELRNQIVPDAGGEPSSVTTEGEEGSFTGVPSRLAEHLQGVGELARRYATACGLPQELIAALRWAGLVHDAGKVDPRFQLWLHGGDEVAASTGTALAKSPLPRQDAAARRRARDIAGYLHGQRHELVSLDMAERSSELRERVEAEGADWELVLHLVASHHGWCRPVAPAVDLQEADAAEVNWTVEGVSLTGTTRHQRGRMDSGVVERFWTLGARYGWHELAYLEAVLRLADHRRSAREKSGDAR